MSEIHVPFVRNQEEVPRESPALLMTPAYHDKCDTTPICKFCTLSSQSHSQRLAFLVRPSFSTRNYDQYGYPTEIPKSKGMSMPKRCVSMLMMKIARPSQVKRDKCNQMDISYVFLRGKLELSDDPPDHAYDKDQFNRMIHIDVRRTLSQAGSRALG